MKILCGLVALFIVIAGFFLPEKKVLAQFSLFLPFGGKVITTFAPPVVCPAGEGPITIVPALPLGITPTAPYAVTFATVRYLYNTILPGSWIIGLYLPTPIPECFIPVPPPGVPIPVPVFPIIMFGVSMPSL